MGKIVWVLGAGFSKHLGGPLMSDLLREPTYKTLIHQYGKQLAERLSTGAVKQAVWLYNYGVRFRYGPWSGKGAQDGGEMLWEDAEQFLDTIESAATGAKSGLRQHLLDVLQNNGPDIPGQEHPDLADVTGGARRLLAAETAIFLRNFNTDSERFYPYRHWEKHLLDEKDTIITFNYDLVPKKLSKPFVVVPSGDANIPHNQVATYKLHGSVDWVRQNGMYRVAEDDSWLTCDDDQLGILAPGPSKFAAHTVLKQLWDDAMSALKAADAVVFLGYRFPPTDSMALGRIFDALANSKPRYQAVHIVLGLDSAGHRERLASILEAARAANSRNPGEPLEHDDPSVKSGRIFAHPLYAQDFFITVKREWLEGPGERFRWLHST